MNMVSNNVFIDRNAHDVCEYEVHRFSVFASDVGIPPGLPPVKIDTNLGNGQSFALTRANDERWEYAQVFGCITLTVYND